MAQLDSIVEELLTWAKKLGTTLSQDVEIYEDPTTGLSFRATKDIPPETKLVNCSYGVTLSFLNAIDIPGFPRHTSVPLPQLFLDDLLVAHPHIIGHFFLMQQYLLGERSFWWPYIRLLPQPDKSSSIPALWPEEDQRFLDGTNAEPAIKKRTELWSEDWVLGINVFQSRVENWERYTSDLYEWAASIFGSRSFRPSLTIPEILVPNHKDHVAKDKFSILLPVMDIGNHNGINNVSWVPDTEAAVFALSNRGPIRQNDQIFNYYGDKSNSELLVGYGFTLPATPYLDRDVVNLKLKPDQGALELRRSQSCHVIPRESEEEFMFAVQKPIHRGEDRRLEDFELCSDGLIDLLICVVANKREKQYLSRHSDHCPEKDTAIYETPLARAVFKALQVLLVKLVSEKDRIVAFEATRQNAQTGNQRTAVGYTRNQLSVLSTIISKLNKSLSRKLCTFSIKDGLSVPPNDCQDALSLEYAFDWLEHNYRDIYTAVVELISEDQEESLPLNCNVLVEDWDHTYWTVWIFTIWMLWARDGEGFRERHSVLASWLIEMNRVYDEDIASPKNEILHADSSELSTINLMVRGISELPQLSIFQASAESRGDGLVADVTRLRNFASYIAQEETVSISLPLGLSDSKENISEKSGIPDQRFLFITKGEDDQRPNRQGSWVAYVSQTLAISGKALL